MTGVVIRTTRITIARGEMDRGGALVNAETRRDPLASEVSPWLRARGTLQSLPARLFLRPVGYTLVPETRTRAVLVST